MRVRPGGGLMLGVISVVPLLAPAPALLALVQETSGTQTSRDPDAIEKLLDGLGDEQYIRREQATRQLFARGPEIAPRLRARLARETDPEIQHRLRYILENIVPPQQAALLVRTAAETDLQPGMVITHANSRRVRNQAELRQQFVGAPQGLVLRVRGPFGPQEIGPVEMKQLTELCDYVAPRGEVLARAVRLYATGLAEEAYRALHELTEPIAENELSEPLRARIAYTAGDGATAFGLMAGHAESVRATGTDWSSPSDLDLRGPGKAPFHMEWVVATRAGPDFYATNNDPDLRVQRILLPAHRFADALKHAARYWWQRFRGELAGDDDFNRVAGNQLAVAAWMLYGMDLRSECCRLIEPRSVILRRSPRGTRKWIRVETEAWLPFLAGDAEAALDVFYEDALEVLRHPPGPADSSVLTRNPRVAARVAFFLYQARERSARRPAATVEERPARRPAATLEERIEDGLRAVSHHTHPALPDYLDWMLYALQERTNDVIRRDLQAALPQLPDEKVLPYARAVALLEYVQRKPDQEVLRTARRRVLNSAGTETGRYESEQRDVSLAIVDALLDLAAGRPNEARRRLATKNGRHGDRPLRKFRERVQTAALWHTAAFVSSPPASAANHALLRQAALAVPMGLEREHWLILSRDRRLMRFDAPASLLTALPKPTPSWFPNPLTWPWIGREESSGRTWVYCRRRVIEIDRAGNADGLRLNLRTEDIPAFDRYVGPRFSQFAEAVAAVELQPGENSEFLRCEIKAHSEYCADPDLQEIGMIQSLRQAPQVVHVALRGGPHLLIDTASGRSWTSLWIQDQLGLETPPEFFAQALWEPAADGSPVVMLMSDQGLIRFELGAEQLTRIALPGSDPYPPLVPESTPYVRRDPRYVYCARLPEDGGQVFRVTLADGSAEEVDMVNEALPAHYYDVRLRAEIRAALNRSFKEARLPDVEAFIADAAETVTRWAQEQQTRP
ncbi:MAG: hypothetical protein ACE5I3_04190 [Phycisphaerae bacterium]